MDKNEIIAKMQQIVNCYRVKQLINCITLVVMLLSSFIVFIMIKDLNPEFVGFKRLRVLLSTVFLVLLAMISIGLRMLVARRNSTCDLLSRIEKVNYCISKSDLYSVVRKSKSLVKWFS